MSLPGYARCLDAFFSRKSSGNICDTKMVIMVQSCENLMPGIYAQAWVSWSLWMWGAKLWKRDAWIWDVKLWEPQQLEAAGPGQPRLWCYPCTEEGGTGFHPTGQSHPLAASGRCPDPEENCRDGRRRRRRFNWDSFVYCTLFSILGALLFSIPKVRFMMMMMMMMVMVMVMMVMMMMVMMMVGMMMMVGICRHDDFWWW